MRREGRRFAQQPQVRIVRVRGRPARWFCFGAQASRPQQEVVFNRQPKAYVFLDINNARTPSADG